MATISSLGIGSGLDSNSIITQLMELEQQPILTLQKKEAGYYAQLSAFGQLRSAVGTYQSAIKGLSSASTLASYTATSADTAKFTASASSSAAKGTYNIQVTTLATVHKQNSSALANSDTATVGSAGDKVEITIDSKSFSVDIGGRTLSGIASAINDASDNVGVTATVLQESDSSFRLVLASDNSGSANSMTLAFKDSADAPITDPLGMTEVQPAVDASFSIDNIALTRSSNTVSDAIQGVTINLHDVTTSSVQLSVTVDAEAITSKVQSFVDSYNELQSTLTELGEGDLSGDTTLRLLDSRIRPVLNTPPSGLSGAYSTLSDIGIEFQKDGTLTLNSVELNAAINADLDGVTNLFADDDQGYAFRLDALIENILGTDGLIDTREDGINSRIDNAQQQIDSMSQRLESVEARLRTQFSALDSLVANLQSTGDYLSQQFDMLNSLVTGKK